MIRPLIIEDHKKVGRSFPKSHSHQNQLLVSPQASDNGIQYFVEAAGDAMEFGPFAF